MPFTSGSSSQQYVGTSSQPVDPDTRYTTHYWCPKCKFWRKKTNGVEYAPEQEPHSENFQGTPQELEDFLWEWKKVNTPKPFDESISSEKYFGFSQQFEEK